MENYDTYKQAISEAEKAEGTAARKMQAYNESIAYSINQLSAAWEGFAQKLEASPIIKGVYWFLTKGVENLDHILQWLMPVIAAFNADKIVSLVKFLSPLATAIPNAVAKSFGEFKSGKHVGSGFYENMTQKMTAENTNAIGELTNAIKDNTVALRGEKSKNGAGGINKGDISDKSKVKKIKSGSIQDLQNQIDTDEQYIQNWKSLGKDENDPIIQRLRERQAEKQKQILKKQERSTRLKTGVVSGIGAGAVRFANKGSSIFDNEGIFKGTGDVEVGTGEALAMGVAQGALTGVATAFMGPAGAVLASIVGDALSSLWKKFAHADEIARKERVQQAKDNLEAIKGITSSVTGLIDLRKKGDTSLWDSDDWKQAGEYVDSITSAMNANEDFKDAMDKAVDGIEGFSWTIEGLTKNQDTLAKIEAARIKYEAEQTYAAGEQDRYDLLKKIEEAQKTLSKSADEEEKKKAEASITANKAAIREYADELNKAYMKSAFYSSGISNMSQAQKNTASLDRLVLEWAIAAQEAAKDTTGEKWLDDQGRVKAESRSTIIQQIREAGGYEAVLTSSEKSVRDYKNANLIAANYVKELGKREGFAGLTVDKLKELANTADGIKKLQSELGKEDAARVIDAINDVDETKIATIAHSLNMTVEEFERANKDGDFDFFTTGMALENLDAFIERIDKLGDSFAELAVKGKLSGDTLNNIIKNYAFLLEGKDSFGTENIVDNLVDLYVGGNDSTLAQAIVGKFQREASTREDWWDAWKNSSIAAGFKETTGKEWKSTTFKTFKEAVNEMSEDEQKSYSEFVASIFNADMLDAINDKIIEYKTNAYDQEIANLQSIKDAIGDVNKQREKELELIKAKEALENASKEKVRVYREGMGFVYTTNQEAVKSAQEKVDELEKQQTQDDLQYQIDILEQQKSILQNIEKNKELKNLTEVVEKIQHALGDKSIFSQIVNGEEEQGSLAETIRDGIVLSTEETKKEENEDAAKAAAKELEKSGAELFKFVGENSAILTDPNNPAYGQIYDEYEKKWNDFIDKRSNFENAASAVDGGLQTTYDIDGTPLYSTSINEAEGVLKYIGRSKISKKDRSNRYKIGIGSTDSSTNEEKYIETDFDSSTLKKLTGEDIRTHIVGKNRSSADKYIVIRYDEGSKEWKRYKTDESFEELTKRLLPYDVVINDWNNGWWHDRAIFMDKDGKTLRWVNADGDIGSNYNDQKSYEDLSYLPKNASGTLSSTGGPSLINENGLESIITPQGTITSLPAKSGIIPADLTRNLWALGEVAPNLIARLGGSNLQTNNNVATNDNSINVDTLNATFNTTKDFDTQKFWMAVKNETILTKNNH